MRPGFKWRRACIKFRARDQIELADAIAEGARRRPSQALAAGPFLQQGGRVVRARSGVRRPTPCRRKSGRSGRGSIACSTASRTCGGGVPRAAIRRLPLNAQQYHPAPERRSPLDARADRQLAPEITFPTPPDVVVYLEALNRHVAGRRLERLTLLSPFVLRTVDPPLETPSTDRRFAACAASASASSSSSIAAEPARPAICSS